MSDFDTKLIEVITKLHIYAGTPFGHSDRTKLDKEIVSLIADLVSMNVEKFKEEEQTSIDELDLSVRSMNLLLRGGIKTIGDLENATFDYILHLRNMGLKSTLEIYTKLVEWKEKNKRSSYERNKSVCR